MPSPPPILPYEPPALTAEHLAQLAAARTASRKIRRAINVAVFDGYTIAVFATITVITGLTDPPTLILGLVMAVVAAVEFRGVSQLRQLNPDAPRTLGVNQLVFAAALILYAVTRLVAARNAPSAYQDYTSGDAELARMIGPVEDLARQLTQAVYGALIAVALVGQGGLALYYFSRPRHLQAYLAQTPPWILSMQRAGVRL